MVEIKKPKLPKAPKLYDIKKSKAKYDPAKQSAGIKKRIEGAGQNVKEALDNRNAVEKALNLKEDQNAIFDFFEILNRPQQALFGGIQAAIKGEDILTAAEAGIKGKTETRFKDILIDSGVVAESKNGWGWDDTLGLVGDVFIDPADWALLPLAGAMKTAQALYKAADTIDTIGDSVKAAETAFDALKAASLMDEAGKVGFLADAANGLLKPADYLRAVASGMKKSTSVTEVAFRGVGSAIKNTAKGVDWGINTLLTRVDDFAEASPAFKSLLSDATKKLELAQGYQDIKKMAQTLFDTAAAIPRAVLDRVSKFNNARKQLVSKMLKRKDIITDTITDMAKKAGVSVDEMSKRFYRSIEQAKYKPLTSLEDYLSESSAYQRALDVGTKNRLVDTIVNYTRVDGLEQFTKAEIEAIFSEQTLANGVVVYFGDGKKIKAIKKQLRETLKQMSPKDSAFFKELLTKENLQAPKILNDAELAEIKSWENLEFIDAREKVYTQLRAMLGDLDETFGTTFKAFPEGYIRRTLSDDATEFTQLNRTDKFLPEDDDFLFSGNTKKFAERKFRTSTQEANLVIKGGVQNLLDRKMLSDKAVTFFKSKENFKFFEEDLMKSINDFIEEGPQLAAYSKVFNEVIVAQLFDDPNLMSPYLRDTKVPFNKTVISKEQLVDKAKQISEYIKDDDFLKQFIVRLEGKNPGGYGKLSEYINTLPRDLLTTNPKAQLAVEYLNSTNPTFSGLRKRLKDLNVDLQDTRLTELLDGLDPTFGNQKYLIDKGLLDILGITINRKENLAIFKLYDKFNDIFKTLKLLTPGFHMRNLVGNFTNLMLSGANMRQFASEAPMAIKVMTQGEKIFTKTITTPMVPLTGEEQMILRYYKAVTDNGFTKIGSALRDLPEDIIKALELKTPSKNLLRKATNFNASLNEVVDSYYRINGYIYASKHPEILGRLGLANPESFVRRVFFDPNDLTKFEKETMRRLIPFYTFTKKNLAYQLKNLPQNTVIYKRLKKTIGTMWDNLDIGEENVEQYKLDNFWIPVTRLDSNGKYTAVKLNLPVGDVGEFIQDPARKLLSAASPLFRAPWEMITNKSIYTDLPISEFEGQKGYNIPGVDRYTEYMLMQSGLDVPYKSITSLIQGTTGLAKGEDDIGTFVKDTLGRTIVSTGDINRTAVSRNYAELKQLQNLLRFYKQEGIEIPTINELENKNINDYYKNINNILKQYK